MYRVLKRDGTSVEFEISKISGAMVKAFEALNKNYHPSVINLLALQVTADFDPKIKDGVIAYIGNQPPAEDFGEVYDGTGRLLMPGFVNAHSHSGMTLMRGYGENLALSDWLNTRIFPFEETSVQPQRCLQIAGRHPYSPAFIRQAREETSVQLRICSKHPLPSLTHSTI